MKKFVLLSFLICGFSAGAINYVVSFQRPLGINNCNASLIYQGNKYFFEDGSCVFEAGAVPAFFLVFSPDIDFSKSGSIFYMLNSQSSDCKAYLLTFKESFNGDEESCSWDVEEYDSSKIPKNLPEYSIIIQLPSNFIKGLDFSKSIIRPNSRNLPDIILNPDLDQKTVDKVLENIVLKSIDNNALLSNQKIERAGKKVNQFKSLSSSEIN